MSAHRSTYLVAAFLSILAARGLHAETLDPWRGWVAFKQFAREVAEEPDPGVSVHIPNTESLPGSSIQKEYKVELWQPPAGQ